MRITIEIHGFIEQRSLHLKKELTLRKNGTMADALVKIGKKLRIDLVDSFLHKVNPVIMLNNLRVDIGKDISKELHDGDAIVIFQQIAGG